MTRAAYIFCFDSSIPELDPWFYHCENSGIGRGGHTLDDPKPGGGGGTGGGRRQERKSTFTNEQIIAALNACLENYGICVSAFDPSEKGKDGNTTLVLAQSGGSSRAFSVKNDVTAYNRKGITFLFELKKGYPFSGGDYVAGLTIPERPYVNYTALDRETAIGPEPALSAILGDFTDTQIHELGHSIGVILQSNPGLLDNDLTDEFDAGTVFANCVYDKLVGRGK